MPTHGLPHNHSASSCLLTLVAVAGGVLAVPANAGPETRVIFDIGMRGQVLGSDVDSRLQVDEKGQMTAMRTRLSGGRVEGELGDVNAAWDELSLASRSFYGVKLGLPTGKVTTTLLGGSVAIQDLRGNSSISPVYGLRAAWKLNPKFSLNASQLLASNASGEQGKSISALSLSYSFQPQTRVAMEMARSSGGSAWQLSALHSSRNLTARALYRSADLGFSSAGNPNLIRERNGYSAAISTQSGPFSLSVGSQRFQDGREGREFVDRATLGFAKRGLPSVSLYHQSSEQLTLPFSPLDLGNADPFSTTEKRALLQRLQPTQTRNSGLQISHSIANTNLTLGFDRSESHLTDTPLSAQNSDRINLSLSRPFGTRTSAQIFQSWTLQSKAEANANQMGQSTRINVNHRLNNGIALAFGLQRQEVRSGPIHGTAVLSDIGVLLPLGRLGSVGVQYCVALSGSGPVSAGTDRLQIRYSRNFNMGRSAKTVSRTREQRRLLGRVVGRVFEDTNNNGRWDEGESAIPNVAVSLRGSSEQRSDRQGNYRFDDVSPFKTKVALVNKTLPIEFAVLSATEVPITPAAGQTVTVDFPAVRTGSIEGVVFEDLNRNGQREADEKMLPDVMVQIENSEVISFSGERGEFTLSNLPAQTYKVFVDTASMAGDFEMTAPGPVEITVAPNNAIKGVLLGVAAQNKNVVNTFNKSE